MLVELAVDLPIALVRRALVTGDALGEADSVPARRPARPVHHREREPRLVPVLVEQRASVDHNDVAAWDVARVVLASDRQAPRLDHDDFVGRDRAPGPGAKLPAGLTRLRRVDLLGVLRKLRLERGAVDVTPALMELSGRPAAAHLGLVDNDILDQHVVCGWAAECVGVDLEDAGSLLGRLLERADRLAQQLGLLAERLHVPAQGLGALLRRPVAIVGHEPGANLAGGDYGCDRVDGTGDVVVDDLGLIVERGGRPGGDRVGVIEGLEADEPLEHGRLATVDVPDVPQHAVMDGVLVGLPPWAIVHVDTSSNGFSSSMNSTLGMAPPWNVVESNNGSG